MLEATAAGVRAAHGTRVVAVPGDVGEAVRRRALVAAAGEPGGLDLPVNDAGVPGAEPLVRPAENPLDGLRAAFETNVVAALGRRRGCGDGRAPGTEGWDGGGRGRPAGGGAARRTGTPGGKGSTRACMRAGGPAGARWGRWGGERGPWRAERVRRGGEGVPPLARGRGAPLSSFRWRSLTVCIAVATPGEVALDPV
ncbi:hypothetical protein GCM10010363_43330 [Streptomyces omiyaensis]|nr:hypothetical protein GCM10010363_43330 [Streptomyces omiyaensis]